MKLCSSESSSPLPLRDIYTKEKVKYPWCIKT